MSTLEDFDGKLVMVIRDEAGVLSEDDRAAFIQEAVSRYSQDRPLEVVAEISGDGGYDYDLPDGWEEGFSTGLQVEYPAGQQQPNLLEANDWMIYRGATGSKLRFLADSPRSGSTILFTITVRHQVMAEASTVPLADQDAVVNLAGARCCQALAQKYAQSSEPSMGADAVNYGNKSGDYAKRAKELEALYKAHITPAAADGGVPPASASGDWDLTAGWGTSHITHPKRLR